MIYRILIFILLFVVGADAQIRRLVIDDFSGGMNRAAPSLVQPNQCWDMENFDVTPEGMLGPRRGFAFAFLAGDSTVGTEITGLIPYNRIGFKHLLIQRGEDTTLWSHVKAGTEDSVLTTLNAVIDAARPQTGVTSFYYKGNTYIASAGSEMMVYDGTKMWPARPLGPSQPSAVAIDNAGTDTVRTGTFRYRYAYVELAGGPDTAGNLSIPTFPVTVYNGVVYVSGIITHTGAGRAQGTYIYRSTDGGPYVRIDLSVSGSEFAFIDTFALTTDTADHPYGDVARCRSEEDSPGGESLTFDELRPPGALTTDNAPNAVVGYGITYPDSVTRRGMDGNWSLNVAYSVVFVDSAGRQSFMSPPTCAQNINDLTGSGADTSELNTLDLSNIPVPPDTSLTKHKLLLRTFARLCDADDCPGAEGDYDTLACADAGNYYILDTLGESVTTYTDSMPNCSLIARGALYCPIDPDSVVTLVEHSDSVGIGFLQVSCQDSVISFKPSQIIQRGSQAFAIGDPEHPDRIYFSTFYDAPLNHGPTTWVADKFWEIPSDQGDWFVRLAVLGDAIYAFRQHSIVKISGFTFYQYQIQQFSNEVGAIAPRSVVATLSHIYFADASGIYVTGGGPPTKISTPIDSIWTALNNSPFTDYRRAVIGFVWNKEYWLQTGTSAYGTLIFNEKNGAWRRSSVEYSDIISYNKDTTALDFGEPLLMIVHGDDSIFQQSLVDELDLWNLVGDTAYDMAYTYWSRELFEGPDREKIHYIDVFGRGRIDSINLTSYRENTTIIDTTSINGAAFGDSVIYWGNFGAFIVNAKPSRRVRLIINQIVPSYQFKLEVFPTRVTTSANTFAWGITSIVVGWQPWDEGRPR